ncbi:DNA-binding transcriptional regulator, AcrR family [Fontibacillus panacisegetis]|uniref:DNA-binding transcriptional regulator, AcrR family n=1 Tax=Fontibacillus panacisegetis TaxID=670482 RepID=A0A1G7IVW6_9BACL|nr:TetR/AcrR family transcriptional regulator [Fontibacillus panacisegetis]SDF16746.1 DNA-binding transcriptional regulator, AcrR family [Fontibacillus panacisegetis]
MIINPKSERARHKIVEAFLHLLGIKAFEKITVKEVMEQAGVSRSVFYSHFESKEAVFSYIMDHIFYPFLKEHMMEEDYFSNDQIIWDYINLYDQYGQVFIMLQRYNVDVILTKKMIAEIGRTMCTSFEQDSIIKEYAHYFFPYIVSSIISVTTNWVRGGKRETKEELFKIIKHFKYKGVDVGSLNQGGVRN